MDRDICQNRHHGNAESKAAHARVRHSADEQRAWLLKQIERAGPFGRTCDELAAIASELNGREVPPNRIRWRLSELKAARLIERCRRYPSRKTRAGSQAAVLVLPHHNRQPPAAVWMPGRDTPEPVQTPSQASGIPRDWHPRPDPVPAGKQMRLW
jgi:hypothetical protein